MTKEQRNGVENRPREPTVLSSARHALAIQAFMIDPPAGVAADVEDDKRIIASRVWSFQPYKNTRYGTYNRPKDLSKTRHPPSQTQNEVHLYIDVLIETFIPLDRATAKPAKRKLMIDIS